MENTENTPDPASESDLDSLPSVIESVSHAQRHQFDQLLQHQDVLQQLKIKLQAELEKVSEARRELTDYEKQRFCQNEEIAEHTSNCAKYKKEIVQLLEEDFQLAMEMESLRKKLDRDKRVHEEYNTKMIKHKASALELEKNRPIQLALAKQEEMIKKLNQEKEDLVSSVEGLKSDLGPDPLSKLKAEIGSLKEVKEQLEQDLQQRENRITEERQHQACLQQDVSVLKKRNHAQLLRLRNQVKEAQMRNRQWHEEACQLEQQIAQLQEVLNNSEA